MCYNGCMERVTVNAHAKLNLTLEVTGREGAFHTLDSLAVSLFSDRIGPKLLRAINAVCGVVIIFYGLKLLYGLTRFM